MSQAYCPICRVEVPSFFFDHPNGARIQCPRCGTYKLMERGAQLIGERQVWNNNVFIVDWQLSGAIRQRFEDGMEPIVNDPEETRKFYRAASTPLEVIDRILIYLQKKSPGGHKYVPLIGHRDFSVGGAESPEAFDHALGQAMSELGYVERRAQNEAAYRMKPNGWARLQTFSVRERGIVRIFLSHAAVDAPLAMLMKDALMLSNPNCSVFAASRSGDIRGDEDWLPAIQRELQAADAYCVLLTPQSTGRPWVWFETGAAWMSGKTWVLARAFGLTANEVALPLSVRQTYSLDDPSGAFEVFRALGSELRNPDDFSAQVAKLRGGS